MMKKKKKKKELSQTWNISIYKEVGYLNMDKVYGMFCTLNENYNRNCNFYE